MYHQGSPNLQRFSLPRFPHSPSQLEVEGGNYEYHHDGVTSCLTFRSQERNLPNGVIVSFPFQGLCNPDATLYVVLSFLSPSPVSRDRDNPYSALTVIGSPRSRGELVATPL